MTSALIGFSGFVGGNIARQASFNAYFNSKNINDLRGRNFDLVVCAGIPAVKWRANKNPERDWAIIKSLIEIFCSITARRFVLISTVDVYQHPIYGDEETFIDLEGLHPYGRHRLLLERALEGKFDALHVVRLPALFGPGLKKNPLFDLICHNQIEKINLESSFQWYPLMRIWSDIEKILEYRFALVNLAVEPVSMQLIKDRFFSDIICGAEPSPPAHYDIRTLYSQSLGGKDKGYVMRSPEVLEEIASWLKSPEVHYA